MAELFFWPALVGYGAYPLAGRWAVWGVRLGWLAQTALLIAQAARADGFPWSSWAGSLNLFVWLVVSAYLIWGCRARFRLLGLVVLPLAATLFVVARLGGGTSLGEHSRYSSVFLVAHVGLVLAAFAGFTLAAGLAAVYLFQERRLKRHDTAILRVPAPALETLDTLAARTIAVSLPALTLGIVVGVVRLRERGGGFDALMAFTVATWFAYGAYVALRWRYGWRGRRAAYFALASFVLVIVVRLALPVTHFS